MKINVAAYKKFVAAIATVVAVVAFAVSDGTVDTQEAAAIVSSAIGAGFVFGLRNKQLEAVKAEADEIANSEPKA